MSDLSGQITDAHREIMRHSLGLPQGKGAYRNHFCAGAGHADVPLLEALCAEGYMTLSHRINDGRDGIYIVTDSGRRLLSEGK